MKHLLIILFALTPLLGSGGCVKDKAYFVSDLQTLDNDIVVGTLYNTKSFGYELLVGVPHQGDWQFACFDVIKITIGEKKISLKDGFGYAENDQFVWFRYHLNKDNLDLIYNIGISEFNFWSCGTVPVQPVIFKGQIDCISELVRSSKTGKKHANYTYQPSFSLLFSERFILQSDTIILRC